MEYQWRREGVREDWTDAHPATIISVGLNTLFDTLDAAFLDVESVTITTRFGNPMSYRRKVVEA